MIEGNVLLSVEDLQTVEGVNQLNRMIRKLYNSVDEDSIWTSMLFDDGLDEQDVN